MIACRLPGAKIALAWMLAKPEITFPIIGASKINHLEDSVAAIFVKLFEEDMKLLEALYQPHPVLSHK